MKPISVVRLQKKYRGQWVVIDKWIPSYKVIAHGNDPRKVAEEARTKGYKTPIVLRIPMDARAYMLDSRALQ